MIRAKDDGSKNGYSRSMSEILTFIRANTRFLCLEVLLNPSDEFIFISLAAHFMFPLLWSMRLEGLHAITLIFS